MMKGRKMKTAKGEMGEERRGSAGQTRQVLHRKRKDPVRGAGGGTRENVV